MGWRGTASRWVRRAYHSLFCELRQHHNDGRLVLPHHPPEVLDRVLQRRLGGYEGTLDLIALHTMGRRETGVEEGGRQKGREGETEAEEGEGGGDERGGRGGLVLGYVAGDKVCRPRLTSMKLALM